MPKSVSRTRRQIVANTARISSILAFNCEIKSEKSHLICAKGGTRNPNPSTEPQANVARPLTAIVCQLGQMLID
jgi:hypothetical protein